MGATIKIHLYFDDRDTLARWVAEYYTEKHGCIDDSEKAWHPEMPEDPDAEDEARAIAEAHARELEER